MPDKTGFLLNVETTGRLDIDGADQLATEILLILAERLGHVEVSGRHVERVSIELARTGLLKHSVGFGDDGRALERRL